MTAKLVTAFTTINSRGYADNKSYPVMIYCTESGGSGFAGALTGTFNQTSGGIRFLIGDENHLLQGVFLRSSNTMSSLNDINSDKGIIVVGNVTFTSGTGSATVSGVKSGARIIASRRQSGATSIILTAICNTDNVVSLGAYDASGSGSNFEGTLPGIIISYDNT